jgi:uncharacterized protein YndB with AHSA1/START domain
MGEHHILHDFPINAPTARVFEAISTPADLDRWWTERCAGDPRMGAEYSLRFGPGYDWRATVTRWDPGSAFELQLTRADADWLGSLVGFDLKETAGETQVRFHHRGWPAPNEHYRISTYCWAMYLRILKRYLEHGELVPYERRLEV